MKVYKAIVRVLEEACWAMRNLAYNNSGNKVKISKAYGIEAVVASIETHKTLFLGTPWHKQESLPCEPLQLNIQITKSWSFLHFQVLPRCTAGITHDINIYSKKKYAHKLIAAFDLHRMPQKLLSTVITANR